MISSIDKISVKGARQHNLKSVNVDLPKDKFVVITGVSGSGKSTLILDILSRTLTRKLYRTKAIPGAHKDIKGMNELDKVISIDQSPIGRTPRSNPATYVGLWSPLRDLFSNLPELKIRGYKP